jgi:hypothetical protein
MSLYSPFSSEYVTVSIGSRATRVRKMTDYGLDDRGLVSGRGWDLLIAITLRGAQGPIQRTEWVPTKVGTLKCGTLGTRQEPNQRIFRTMDGIYITVPKHVNMSR